MELQARVAAASQQAASLWQASAPPGPALSRLEGDLTADVAIVGGGYTGLSAAIHLADAGAQAVVLEAEEPGFGASGRNGGQVNPGLKHDPDDLEARYGAETGARLVHTASCTADLVFELIRRFDIPCDAVRTGWIQPAHDAAALATLSARAAQWQRRGVDVRVLSQAEVAGLTGSRRYIGGTLDPRGGALQPLAYARGLARAAVGLGARVYRDSRVLSLTARGDAWHLALAGGSVTARRVILATNAYTDTVHDGLRRSIVAVPSSQVATVPLTAAQRASVLPGGQTVSDSYNLLRYFRLDARGRLVMGTRGLYGARPIGEFDRAFEFAIRDIYPELATVPLEHRWTGYVAMTADHVPHLNDVAPGLQAAVGYNGRGVAMATMLGRLAARRAIGAHDPEYLYPTTPLQPMPLHRFSRIGVRATIAYLRLQDQRRVERDGSS